MTITYTIHQSRPTPAMCEDRHTVAGSYADAVAHARRLYCERPSHIRVTGCGTYSYFIIHRDGTEINRNTNATI